MYQIISENRIRILFPINIINIIIKEYIYHLIQNYVFFDRWRKNQEVNGKDVPEERSSHDLSIRDFIEGIHTGFQLATKSGPLCAEPLMGVSYFLEDFTINIDSKNLDISESL